MLSLSHRFLFIHIPKTAGNAIQTVLKAYSEDEIVLRDPWHDGVHRFEVRSQLGSPKKHATLREYRQALEPACYARLFKFGTVRNPWDRMVSFYFSASRRRHDQERVREWDRDEFIRLLEEKPTMMDYLVAEADDATPAVDCVMRYENLQADFDRVCDRLGIARATLPRVNVSAHRHYSSYYDEELAARVAARYAREIRAFGYEFERAS